MIRYHPVKIIQQSSASMAYIRYAENEDWHDIYSKPKNEIQQKMSMGSTSNNYDQGSFYWEF